MSRAKGRQSKRSREGQAEAEKAQRVYLDPLKSRKQQDADRAEEEYWASLAGPVEIRYVEPRP